ncbi:OmdA domain containing protein [Arthrobacter sp. SW1]|uniref:YdeI/OmpD-associated family protein n=1 Tax=Arthrobacter sp. SW1 TaxID=1920889 RepID=UPI000877B717|nr:YdeI/OmpD-associated family protein [Arthrobacter sp. SW1]OFI36978.1 OmdA domain containing protein [Arthrobacter sp. SW1]
MVISGEPLAFRNGAEWTDWLAAHHSTEAGAWLLIGKKKAGTPLLSIGEALDAALCFGWIDGQRKGFDQDSFLQRYSRRGKRSSWSKVNVGKAEALIAAGRMQPPGFAEIEAAKADGRWDAAYESQRTAEVPDDVASAIAANPAAAVVFEKLGRTARYSLILPLLKARTPEFRAKLLAGVVRKLAEEA